MLSKFKKLRRSSLSLGNMKSYFLYAIGEILLVTFGILLALQVNNWNQNKQDQSTIGAYLNSILINIKSDLSNAEFINTKRISLLPAIDYVRFNLRLKEETYNQSDIIFTSQSFNAILENNYLNANLSGFESLKNSGYLSKLQGKDIEVLLFQYYSIVEEIRLMEKHYNENLQNASEDFYTTDFNKFYYFFNPEFVAGDGLTFEFLQPYFKEIYTHSSINRIFDKPSTLIWRYENLLLIGKEIIRMIEDKRMEYDEMATQNLKNVFDVNGNIGYPRILINGAPGEGFKQGIAAADGSVDWGNFELNEIVIDFPEIAWGAYYFYIGDGTYQQRKTKDYSVYQSLTLELKGKNGGESVYIALKDDTDPDDGSESKILLTLTNEWATYTIPLTAFETADLKRLFVVPSFIFQGTQQTIKIKNIEFVK